MIYIENVILDLRTMVFEYLNNSLHFKSYERFLEKKSQLVPWYTKIAQNQRVKGC